MLKLDRLEISGFKSFVDPVATAFADGITCIVGPNGCGKSNLSEAITWVLGEQSAKSLRGGRMEDVIFSGTDQRKALGMAEVNMSFRTEPGHPHADDDGRITIGRRVFRSGEGQYRLNDQMVRLKDIKDVLMDTGLGVRAYAVIEQGRIGQILSGKPQDRRRLIEEAAGITRYRQRKRVAELKLQEASANLLRLDDILSEVERALRSLKRQANSARRYQEREREFRQLLERFLVARWAVLENELTVLKRDLSERTAADAELGRELNQTQQAASEALDELDSLGKELAKRHERQTELAGRIEGRQEFVKATRQTLTDIDERLHSGTALAGQREREIEAARQSLGALSSRGEALASERDQARDAVLQDQRRIELADEHARTTAAELEDMRGRLMAAMNRVSGLQNRMHQQQLEAEKGTYRHDHLRTELAERRALLAKARETAEAAEHKVSTLGEQEAALVARRKEVEENLQTVLTREAETQRNLEEAQDRLSVMRNRRTVLEELERAQVERRAKIKETLDAQGFSHLQFLDQVVTVPSGWEAALDLWLGQLRDALLVPGDEDVMALAEALTESDSSATLLRETSPGDRWSADLPRDPAIRSSLGEALGLPRGFADSLPPAFLVEDRDDADRLARTFPAVAFISRDRLWAQNGVLHLQGQRAAPGTLTRQRELTDIHQGLPTLEEHIAATKTERTRLVEERTAAAANAHRLDQEIAACRQELAVAEARKQDTLHRQQRAEVDCDELGNQEGELVRELERLEAARSRLVDELTTAQEEHAALEQHFDRAQAVADEARAARAALETEGAGRRGRLELLQERVSSHGSERTRLEEQIKGLTATLAGWLSDRAMLTERKTSLRTQLEAAQLELQEALEDRSGADQELVESQQALDDKRAELQETEKRLKEMRERRELGREQIEELRVVQAERLTEGEHLQDSFRESFGRSLPMEPELEEELREEAAMSALEDRVSELKRALEKMGPVNVLAAHEYAEQEERFEFLSEQRQDVVSSITSLRNTIKELNDTSTKRFLETFGVVNEAFGRMFVDLFQGGEALMRLMDEDEPLECGIEITARPPGKRPQNINLLSGGEKALTAIALLFALFQTRPSPFCILDEVDAPLDDANILRFVKTLRKMAEDTQFLVISHNKLTMEAASSLYGVTMEEKGVSKLVGVEVDKIHPEKALAS